MEMMKLVADRHGLACLLHEKPFEGINGSGKHNNWSLITNTGANLLYPGRTPAENTKFLVFLMAVIKAVDEYADLLRVSVATAGNDHRLGANEAPPAIVSVFLGDELTAVLKSIENDEYFGKQEKVAMQMGTSVIPQFFKDTTDRNRTSPFAFTGNKFEFRMPGSAVNLADCNMVLNTAMAKSLKDFADAMEGKSGDEFESAAIAYIKETLKKHQRIIFNGNGYSDEWPAEAERRGLANNRTTADALPAYVAEKSIKLFEEFNVLTEVEARSRYEVKLEKYTKLMNIEVRTMKRMTRRTFLPAINKYATLVANEINEMKAACAGIDTSVQDQLLNTVVDGIKEINDALNELHAAHLAIRDLTDEQEKANKYAHEIVPMMERLRAGVDAMEIVVAHDLWPVPTYNDILFYC